MRGSIATESKRTEDVLQAAAVLILSRGGRGSAGSPRRRVPPFSFKTTISNIPIQDARHDGGQPVRAVHTVLSSEWTLLPDTNASGEFPRTVEVPIALAYSLAHHLNTRETQPLVADAESVEDTIRQIISAVINDDVIIINKAGTSEARRRIDNGEGFTLDEITPRPSLVRASGSWTDTNVSDECQMENQDLSSFSWTLDWDEKMKMQCSDWGTRTGGNARGTVSKKD